MSTIPEYLQKIVRGEIPPPPITTLLGFALTSVEPGKAIIELNADDRHVNPFGGIHGGLISNIADAAMGAAYHSTLEENETCTTLELKISFLRPAPKGKLRAEGKVIKQGQKIGFLECDVTDDKGQLFARATATLLKQKGEFD